MAPLVSYLPAGPSNERKMMGTDLTILPEISHDGQGWRPLSGMSPQLVNRDYPLFALLSNVRNHAGLHTPIWQAPREIESPFGGTVSVPGWWYDVDDGGHDPLDPISSPRGVPDDACEPWKRYVERWKRDSEIVDASWVTVEDVVSADWDQVVYSNGVITEDEYLAFRDMGIIPTSAAMGAGGPGTRVVNEVQYAAGVRGESVTAVSARWKRGTLRDCSGGFLELAQGMNETLPPTSNVRFMLLFDS